MGAGVGVVFVLAGAVLFWAVDVDLPNVDESAFGAILMVCGIIALAASTMPQTRQMQNGVGSGIGLFAAGAVLVWAVDLDLPYIFDGALGVILMVGGLVSLVATVIMHVHSSRPNRVLERRY